MSTTPMMHQYQSIRRTLPAGTLLLFRLGDFYELFFEDAKLAAGILNVALTKRNGMPMCGVPYHAAEMYVAKLVKAGHRLAICDQISDPVPGKIVDRQVSQIISPGTVIGQHLLEPRRNLYLAGVHRIKNAFGVAFLDLSTGEFRVAELGSRTGIKDELARFTPSELIRSEAAEWPDLPSTILYDAYAFEVEQARDILCRHFQVQSLDGFGCQGLDAAVGAAGAVLHYVTHQLRRSIQHVRSVGVYLPDEFMALDSASQYHLELVAARSGERDTSLLAAVDRTITPMAARLLRQWLLKPLRSVAKIQQRQAVVGRLLEQPHLLAALRQGFKEVRDIERTVGRLSQSSGNARDLGALRASLAVLPEISHQLLELRRADLASDVPDPLEVIAAQLHLLPELCRSLQSALNEELPATLKEGGIFRPGYHAGLDEMRHASTHGKSWVAQLQEKEIERTGIKSLKVRFNSVFGYFIEVTKANLDSIPADYVRKQTTVNGERFITPGLKEAEAQIFGADERARQLEYQLFLTLREEVLVFLPQLQATAHAIAQLDTLAGLAETARLYGYIRPKLHHGGSIQIVDGRHPVLDQNLTEEKFVPNDCHLDQNDRRMMLITGPNMAGKSTYIRQVALLVILAQIGSFIPAATSEIGVVDRIYTRVGASDDLARGQSTFMVEMNETANIVHNATRDSLVILDEIGRGTSTFDGLSIAWSVAEYLHDVVGVRTLFATHYHEMTELAVVCPGVRNYNVSAREWGDRIIFLRKIVPGPADKSYGIQVARLAGLPPSIVDRAREILSNLEASELNAQGRPRLAEAKILKTKRKMAPEERPQLNLFDLPPT